MHNQIIFVNRDEILSKRQQLIKDAAKFLSKIVSINVLYSGRLRKEIDKNKIAHYIEKLVRLNALYTNRIYKIEKKLIKLEKLLGE